MPKQKQVPDVTYEEGPNGGTTLTHPAFGRVSVSQWYGGGDAAKTRLFGSDLSHATGITLRFEKAVMNRDLSRDWHFGKEMILEVEMSESQWSRFVASSGRGEGTPVTIRYYRDGELIDVPSIAEPRATKREVHGEEMDEAVRERLTEIRRLTEKLGDMLDGKAPMSKKELRELHRDLDRHVVQMPGSVKFVYDQFARAVEAVTSDAKIEVEAFVDGMARQIGMEHLRAMAPGLDTLSEHPGAIEIGDGESGKD